MSYTVKTIEWRGDEVVMIDQRVLPLLEEYIHHATWQEVGDSIRKMVIRGAPAIGVATAMGIALAAMQSSATSYEELKKDLEAASKGLFATRPTAYNLGWALQQQQEIWGQPGDPDDIRAALKKRSQEILEEDIAMCMAMGEHAAPLFPPGARILTHCNAGALATAGYGTALGVIRSVFQRDPTIHVFADETRPFLQGARLTAWELQKEGIPCSIITDNMSGYFFKKGEIDAVVVGSDRIAANGDVANKIGTYTVSVLAREHGVPFYVAAPTSTVDLSLADGSRIPIEEREICEVTHIGDHQVAPDGIAVRNPAFDVTPHQNVTAIITEAGVHREPYIESLAGIKKGK
ncbi:MAG: S-methyl-5-thioribose-1-phosphate isomerase [Thermoleophilia bacterium]|nr:S-methyl-5-thioribose-1-phosphate isomerase [Thermoleophilia bacterium]